MSHSVRRLWTGAIVLALGCQSVPSGLTQAFVRAHEHADAHSTERRQSATPMTAAAQDRPHTTTPLGEERAGSGDRHPAENQHVRGKDSVPGTSTWATEAGVIHDPSPRPATPHLTSQGDTARERSMPGIADPFASNSALVVERSLFQESQGSMVRPEHASRQTQTAPDLMAAASAGADAADFEAGGQRSSAVGAGHEVAPSPRRHPLRDLEAPTPFSVMTPPEWSDHPPSDREGNPAGQDRVETEISTGQRTGLLFDVFGVGGERIGERRSESPGLLGQPSVARLQRPQTDSDSRSVTATSVPPPIESLRKPLQTVHWQEELDRLTTLLETQLAHQTPGESPTAEDYYLRQHVALRLLYLIGSRRQEALQAIPHCDPDQQEFWTNLLWALSNIFDDEAMPDQSDRSRETAARLRAALQHLMPEAGLELPRCLFSQRIDGFGLYTTFERDEFTPGQTILLYAEVANFHSRLTPEGQFVTTLQSTLKIHQAGANGPIVFFETLPATEDRCLTRRWDYFHSYRLTLPTNLTPGPHVLTLTVRDENSGKQAAATLPFLIK